ncbi:hypothetical protein B1L04_19880 [Microcystis aeruginosa KW]|uniref:Uncharacterized protein n=1 Tax=Microcystis aeruginosa KW TaxID=1960155 RepID=A0A1V4BV41_MICAE|nr:MULTISPECIES: hypothetical protein [Microcystis]OPF18079.1 hypothetical protein B1L04_19880 [Microcystis aeruginosa KW]
MDGVIRDETLIEKDIWRFFSIVFHLERTNQLSLLPDKDLVYLCPPIESYQVTKNPSDTDQSFLLLLTSCYTYVKFYLSRS